jgi:molybdopterin adenylyltransferase
MRSWIPGLGSRLQFFATTIFSVPYAIVITVSDSCAAGIREDVSGPAVAQRLTELGFSGVTRAMVPDERAKISAALRDAAERAQLVVTTGGTGIAMRDVTPEATRDVCSQLIDGVSEVMRSEGLKQTPLAALSRALCGVCGDALVLNLPGAPAGALASFNAVAHLLPHALELLAGKTGHR